MSLDRHALPTDPHELQSLVVHLYEKLRETQRRLEVLEERLRRPEPAMTAEASGQRYLFDALAAVEDAGSAEQGESPQDPSDASGAGGAGHEGAPAATRDQPRPRGRRAPLPDHLPRIVERHELSVDDPRRQCPCCAAVMDEIGVRLSEQLDVRPAEYLVRVLAQVEYACRKNHCDEAVARAEKPAQPIERGIPGPGLLAQVLVDRFANHLPYYRQSQMFEREGIELSRGTLSRWAAFAADLLEPIVAFMFEDIRGSRRIHTDDSTFPILDPGAGKTAAAKIWPYVGDKDHPHTVYDVTSRRTRDGPLNVLAGYKGALQADAFSGYDCIFASGDVVEVACWAHARRKFETCTELGAHQMIALIGEMYAHEETARDLASEEERRLLRLEYVVPIIQRIRDCRDRLALTVRPKSELATALGYLGNQWTALTRFATTGHLEPDNNAAERAIKGPAIGRRNWLFGGNLEAAKRAGVLFSLIASCQRSMVNPFDYLRDVLMRVSTHLHSRIAELTPSGWSRARLGQPTSV